MLQNYRVRPALGEPAFSGGAPHTGAWIRSREPHLLDAPLAAAFLDTWFPAPFVRLDAPAAGADDRLHRPLPLAAAAGRARRPRIPTWSPSGRISPATASSRKTASSGRPTASCWRSRGSWRCCSTRPEARGATVDSSSSLSRDRNMLRSKLPSFSYEALEPSPFRRCTRCCRTASGLLRRRSRAVPVRTVPRC